MKQAQMQIAMPVDLIGKLVERKRAVGGSMITPRVPVIVMNVVDEAAIKARFNAKGEDNVIIDGDKVIIRHNKLGWSNDNKNIHGALITSYTSQTTAYILDVMKADAVRNLNRYTFVAFKTMTIAGIDFDTALSMLPVSINSCPFPFLALMVLEAFFSQLPFFILSCINP